MDNIQLETTLDLDRLMAVPNIVPLLKGDDAKKIGLAAMDGYRNDLQSRAQWDERQARANKLALQVFEEKSFPWPGAASVKFPLITVAALQYQAKAYPALVSATDLVKARVIGLDKDGQKSARALRIGTHMTWQNIEQDTGWEEDHDKLLLVQAIAGCAFKKRIYEPGPGRQVARLVLPANLIVNYFSKNLDDSPRYTHTYYLTSNNIKQRELDGRFSELEVEPTINADTSLQTVAKDERQGIQTPMDDRVTPWFTGEQYCWLDLDGDGYQEPYIVTFDIDSAQVRRIVARFLPSNVKYRDGKIYKITPVRVFTKYGFIPSPDGGFYDLGLGSILGPLNETVNTTINQMLDAGTMATLGGGFLGRGFKGKGGAITFQPNQWYPVDAPGDDLRKNVLPLPVKEPSQVLLQLLGLLLQYGERIVSATELQVGENIGQNTPAETARTMNDNGARVYNSIYKRTWRSMRDEFRIQWELNKLYLEVDEDYTELTSGQGAMISPQDYQQESIDVRPAADPHIVSDTQRIDQAKLLASNAIQLPGHNKYQALLRLYKAMNIPNINEIMPPPMQPGPPGPDGKSGQPQPAQDFPPMPNPKMMKAQLDQQEFQLKVKQFQADRQDARIELQLEVQLNQAEIMALYAKAEKLLAEAKGVDTGHQIALIEAQIGAAKAKNEGLMKALTIIQKEMENQHERANEGGGVGGMGSGAANAPLPPTPTGNRTGASAGLAQ
jgi:chaperonin GroES